MNGGKPQVFTIGHSNHPMEYFITLLKQHGIDTVVDVRSKPYCRYARHFDQPALAAALKEEGIRYVFLGELLGGGPDDPSYYGDNERAQYEKLAQTKLFQQGIEHVIKGASRYRIVLMCAEKDPNKCHRGLLVARVLHERGVDVQHILADGELETHDMAMDRLAAEYLTSRSKKRVSHDKTMQKRVDPDSAPLQLSLLDPHVPSREEILAAAIQDRASKIAWKRPPAREN